MRGQMRVIAKHAELDKDHAREGLEAIDALVQDPARLPAMRRVLLASIARFDQFCEEVTCEAPFVDQGAAVA